MAKKVSYKDQVAGAIAALKERSGSSLHAIKKSLGATPAQFRFINAALKAGVASGVFIKNGGKFKNAKVKAAPKKKKPAKKKKPVKKKKAKKKATKKKATKKKATKKKAKKSSKKKAKKSSKKKAKKKKK